MLFIWVQILLMVTCPVDDMRLHLCIFDMFSVFCSKGNFVEQLLVPTWTVMSAN